MDEETLSCQERFAFFLGGADLEMQTIGDLVRAWAPEAAVHDKDLKWGARASAYAADIAEEMAAGRRPVLVELLDDLSSSVTDRRKLIWIDHHGARAGSNAPSSLKQVFGLLGFRPEEWTRHFELVDANDVGHIEEMLRRGATPLEIVAIREADRRSQGVTEADEEDARRAIAAAETSDGLVVVEAPSSAVSAITDFLDPVYGGHGFRNLLVIKPDGLSFFGDGQTILQLTDVPRCWWGGALPDRGYWGVQAIGPEKRELHDRIVNLFAN